MKDGRLIRKEKRQEDRNREVSTGEEYSRKQRKKRDRGVGERNKKLDRGEKQGKRQKQVGERDKGKLTRSSREKNRKAARFSEDKGKDAKKQRVQDKHRETKRDREIHSSEEVADTWVYIDKGQYNATKQKYPHCDSLAHIFTHQRPPYLSFLALA